MFSQYNANRVRRFVDGIETGLEASDQVASCISLRPPVFAGGGARATLNRKILYLEAA